MTNPTPPKNRNGVTLIGTNRTSEGNSSLPVMAWYHIGTEIDAKLVPIIAPAIRFRVPESSSNGDTEKLYIQYPPADVITVALKKQLILSPRVSSVANAEEDRKKTDNKREQVRTFTFFSPPFCPPGAGK